MVAVRRRQTNKIPDSNYFIVDSIVYLFLTNTRIIKDYLNFFLRMCKQKWKMRIDVRFWFVRYRTLLWCSCFVSNREPFVYLFAANLAIAYVMMVNTTTIKKTMVGRATVKKATIKMMTDSIYCYYNFSEYLNIIWVESRWYRKNPRTLNLRNSVRRRALLKCTFWCFTTIHPNFVIFLCGYYRFNLICEQYFK